MTSEGGAPRLFEVDRFEHLSATPERVLLRVDGRYVERPGKRILDATLFVDDGLAVRRHAALPDPARAELDGWLWRAAFSVPASYLTDARISFALEAEPGGLLALPEPRPVGLLPASPELSVRAARTARRYAAAIAVLVTVALAPGVLPANARTEILKVRRPDGSIEYLRADGTPVATIPPDADIVDETASATTVQNDAPTAPNATVVRSDSTPPPPHRAAPKPPPAAPGPQPQQQQVAASPPARLHVERRAPTAHRRVRRHAPARHSAAPPAPRTGSAAPLLPGGELIVRESEGAPRLQSPWQIAAAPARDDQPLKPPSALDHGSGPAETAPALEPLVPLAASSTPPLQQLSPVEPAPAAPQLQQLSPVEPAPAAPQLQQLVPAEPAPTTAAPQLEPLGGHPQRHSGSHAPAVAPRPQHAAPPHTAPAPVQHVQPPAPAQPSAPPAPAGSFAANPSAFNALPGPDSTVPSFVIDRFQIPPFLLSIYQAAATEYGIRWEVLAAINEIETNYGRDLSVSSAGALGWMQFMPDTWKMYGVDANRDGRRDPYNPADAIFAAARYLKAAGGDKDVRQAIFAYNHASWYVDSVMLRAELIAAYPPDLIGALVGLTQGRFPIAAPARYQGEVLPGKPNQSSAASGSPQGTDIYTRNGAPVVAAADGVVKRLGRSTKKGLYVVLQDAYGNEYTYSGLGEIAKVYPVPIVDADATLASDAASPNDPAPRAAATSGSQSGNASGAVPAAPEPIALKQSLFAHPRRTDNRDIGGIDQVFAAEQQSDGFVAYDGYFADALGLNSKNAVLRELKAGAAVIAGTVLGRVGAPSATAPSHIHFEVRPAGKGAPEIDPRPILDGWRLLDSTQAYGPSGDRALSKKPGAVTVGEAMLLPKPLLEKVVLSDKRLKIYAGGRQDIKTGQIDRRVLEVLEYLADAGLNPTVTSLKSGGQPAGSDETGHSTGNAVDISAVNDVPIAGHQDHGGIAEQTVRELMKLQGTLRPNQIVSLLDLGQSTVKAPDHADHIHVGFRPLYGDNAALGKAALSVLGPQQWNQLAQRLGQIGNPVVPTVPSKFALPDS